MSTSPLTHKLQRGCVLCHLLLLPYTLSQASLHELGCRTKPITVDQWKQHGASSWQVLFIGKRLKQKVSILSLPNLPNVNVPRSYSRLGRAQASARSWGGGCSLGRSSLHQGSQAQAPRGFRDLASPLLSISLHSLLTSHAAAVVSREQGPLCSRKLPIVAGVSCPLLAPPAR